MAEALRKIKEDLGPDAVILSTRKVKRSSGVFGMLSRPILEVTAAADLDLPPRRTGEGVPARAGAGRPGPDSGLLLAMQADIDSLREELAVLARRPRTPEAEVLAREVRGLVSRVEQLLDRAARVERLRLAPGLRRLHDHLEAMDLLPSLAARILAFLQEKADAGVVPEGREAAAFRELVTRTVRVSGPLVGDGDGQRVVALVGPTGVGKTTTVAKLAARYALQQGRRVGLVTVDTFRIGAVEQLKTYARIMGVPIRVAVDRDSFRSAVEDLADRELVLVDTAGQSPRDEESLMELLDMFPGDVSTEVHLVLAVTTRSRDLERILRHYAAVRPSRLLLTKLDETDCYGPLLALPLVSRLPLSYLTTGQNVPDDIEEATPEGVAGYLVRGLEGAA